MKFYTNINWRNRPNTHTPLRASELSEMDKIVMNISKPTNCKNCGAVLHKNKCDYCGSEF